MKVYRKIECNDSQSITPSTEKSDFRTDYKMKSEFRTKWEKPFYRKLKGIIGGYKSGCTK